MPYTLKSFTPQHLTVDDPSHIFTEPDCNALWAAYAAGRPLLLKGEPGTGKSQMAKAIAAHLGWAFIEEVVNYHTELNDLFYHFDAVQRLADSQSTNEKLAPENYLSPGALWWAFDWQKALAKHQHNQHRPKPSEPAPDAHKKGIVLLLDEIDKAQPELANGLLGALGNFEFVVPYIKQTIKADQQTPLLVVLTSNDERELPQAFIRRCFVHTLAMESSTEPAGEGELSQREHWLIQRGKAHFGATISDESYRKAAQLLWEDRDSHYGNAYKPGLAEYIDLLKVLAGLTPSEQQQTIEQIAQFVINKNG